MNDGRTGTTAEEAQRFYRENHRGAAAGTGERLVRTASSPSRLRTAEATTGVAADAAPDAAANPAPGAAVKRDVRPETRNPDAGVSDNERALGEKPGQGSGEPGILNRSFSGTYED